MRTFYTAIFLILCVINYSFAEERNTPQSSSGNEFFKQHYIRGLDYAIAGNFKQAEEELSMGISSNHLMLSVLNDAQNGKIQKDVAIDIFSGYKYAYENNWEQMVLSFNNAIKIAGDYVPAYQIRANLYYDIEAFDFAVADFTKIIQLDPENLQAYLDRGSLYVQTGKYDEAIKDCDKAIELNPNIETPYNNRGAAYYFKAEYDKAISDYMKTLEIQPRLVKTYHGLATAFEAKGDKENAIKYYNFFIEYASKVDFEDLINKAKERLQALKK